MSEGLVGGESGAVYADGFDIEQRAGVSAAACNGDLGGSGSTGTDPRRKSRDDGTDTGSGRRIGVGCACSLSGYAGNKEEIL